MRTRETPPLKTDEGGAIGNRAAFEITFTDDENLRPKGFSSNAEHPIKGSIRMQSFIDLSLSSQPFWGAISPFIGCSPEAHEASPKCPAGFAPEAVQGNVFDHGVLFDVGLAALPPAKVAEAAKVDFIGNWLEALDALPNWPVLADSSTHAHGPLIECDDDIAFICRRNMQIERRMIKAARAKPACSVRNRARASHSQASHGGGASRANAGDGGSGSSDGPSTGDGDPSPLRSGLKAHALKQFGTFGKLSFKPAAPVLAGGE